MMSCLQPDVTLLYAANEEQGRSVCWCVCQPSNVVQYSMSFFVCEGVCVSFKVNIIAAEDDVMRCFDFCFACQN